MKTVAWGVMLISIAVAQQPLETTLPSGTEEETAHGLIGQELEIVNANVETLATQITDTIEDVIDSYNTTSQFTALATTLLIDSQLLTLQQDLKETEELIASVEADMNDALYTCIAARSCADCAIQAGCVWCSAEKMCVAGDHNGPRNAECMVFNYGECGGGCGEHGECETCVADLMCGWCIETGQCEAGSATDPGLCNPNHWLFEINQYSNSCPAESQPTLSVLPVDVPFVNTEQNKLQRELRISTRKAVSLRKAIAMMREELESTIITQRSSVFPELDLQLDIGNLTGLNTLIDAQVIEEMTDFLNQTAIIADEIASQEGDQAVEDLDDAISSRIKQEDEILATVTSEIEDLAEEAIENQKKAKEAAKEAEEAKEAAEKAAKEAKEAASESASFLQLRLFLPI